MIIVLIRKISLLWGDLLCEVDFSYKHKDLHLYIIYLHIYMYHNSLLKSNLQKKRMDYQCKGAKDV